jgi:hypothetical protein
VTNSWTVNAEPLSLLIPSPWLIFMSPAVVAGDETCGVPVLGWLQRGAGCRMRRARCRRCSWAALVAALAALAALVAVVVALVFGPAQTGQVSWRQAASQNIHS